MAIQFTTDEWLSIFCQILDSLESDCVDFPTGYDGNRSTILGLNVNDFFHDDIHGQKRVENNLQLGKKLRDYFDHIGVDYKDV